MSIAGVITGQASVTAILRGSGLAPVPIHWTAASDAVDGYNIYRGAVPKVQKENFLKLTRSSYNRNYVCRLQRASRLKLLHR